MKIIEILRDEKLHLSFEVFPPKTEAVYEDVKAATEAIGALGPAFVSVTYGAGGGTSRYTLDMARNLQEKFGLPGLAHLTCVSSDRETVRARIAELREAGIENIMALRGDIPPGREDEDRSRWDYRHAVELVREIRASGGDFCVGGACYPEVHPESADRRDDVLHLKEKVDAGVDFLTTQMFFDNNLLYNFLYQIREAGIFVPVLPGIMPITRAAQVERALKLSGCFVPQRFKALVDRFGSDPAAMKQAGIAYATDQIIDLYANGIRCVHVYTMNKPEVAEAILHNLSDILGSK
jgi:methylenetetrahydrofolate reductase (NADPH)